MCLAEASTKYFARCPCDCERSLTANCEYGQQQQSTQAERGIPDMMCDQGCWEIPHMRGFFPFGPP